MKLKTLITTIKKEFRMLQIKDAERLGKKENLNQVVILVRIDGEVKIVTWGRNKEECRLAGIDGKKIGAILEGAPTSLQEGIKLIKDM